MARGRRDFEYKPPSYEETVERAERKGSTFDTMFKDVKIWTPKQGANLVRLLPPTWENNRGHYGLYIKMHYNVGPDDRRYLCLKDVYSPHKRCPVCEALYDLGPNATQEEKFALRAASGVLYYMVDRDNEKDGVQVWLNNPTNDSEIAAQSVNRRNQSVLPIADPIDGYDIEFSRNGTGKKNTRYRGFQVMRDSSPLSDSDKRMDDWLDTIVDRPLPSVLNYYSPDHIEEVFYGRAKEEAVESSRTRSRSRDEDDNEPVGRSRSRSRDEDEDDQPDERRSSRSRANDDEVDKRDTDDERPTRTRTRLEKDLDDEIPFEAGGRRGRSNGRATDDAESRPTTQERDERSSRRTRDDDENDRPARSSRARRDAVDDDESEPEDRPSRSRNSDDDAHEARRERVRERLNRG